MRCVAVIGSLLVVSGVSAEPPRKAESSMDSVNLLSDCAGYYAFVAEKLTKDNTALTESIEDNARGAQIAAGFLLWARSADPRRVIKDFMPYVHDRAALNKRKMLVLLEKKNKTALQQEHNRCAASMPLQTEAIQQLRNAAE